MDRRTFIMAAGTASLLAPIAKAHAEWKEGPVFRTGPLARNAVANSFLTVPPGMTLPQLNLSAADGTHRLSQLKGKTRIISLWAEWCVPCLLEAKDLAALRRAFAGPEFDMLAVLTAGRGNLTQAQAQAKLAEAGAATLPTWVETGNGREIGKALAITSPPHISLPCNLLIDTLGRVRGRSVGNGIRMRDDDGRSHWASSEAQRFVSALRAGALDLFR